LLPEVALPNCGLAARHFWRSFSPLRVRPWFGEKKTSRSSWAWPNQNTGINLNHSRAPVQRIFIFYRATTGIKLNMPYICRSRNNFDLQKKRHFPNFRGSLPGLNIIYHPVMDSFVGQTNQRRRRNIQD